MFSFCNPIGLGREFASYFQHLFMKLPYLPTLVAIAMIANPLMAESVEDIVKKFDSQKIEALDAYLKANPKADDKEDAITALIAASAAVDDHEQMLAYLKQKYDIMDKGADADLEILIGGVVQPLLGSYLAAGDAESAKTFIETVKTDLAAHPMSAQVNQFLEQLGAKLNQPTVGSTMDIAFTSTAGDEIDLSKMNDKVVLVDFWATWCGPCVAEMPNVIAAYEKYHDKGFEVVGISLDQDKEALDSFTKERGMTWPQYFDGKGWENPIAGKFGITGIPATFLIGKDGKIVATDLRGPALEAQLEKLLSDN